MSTSSTGPDPEYLRLAVDCAKQGVHNGGGPFGAVVVRNGEIVAQANNEVTSSLDTTAHAEIVAIRRACQKLGVFHLTDCELYTSCWCCPMCAAACMWARISHVYSATLPSHALVAGFDDKKFWTEIAKLDVSGQNGPTGGNDGMPVFEYVPIEGGNEAFEMWIKSEDKTHY